jgi:hypothetical protein
LRAHHEDHPLQLLRLRLTLSEAVVFAGLKIIINYILFIAREKQKEK